MKLVLKGFSQEIEVSDLTEAANYLVFEDEETGQPYRLPVLQETITALSEIIVGEGQLHTEHVESIPEEEDSSPYIPPPAAPAPPRKTLRSPRSEDEVAPL